MSLPMKYLVQELHALLAEADETPDQTKDRTGRCPPGFHADDSGKCVATDAEKTPEPEKAKAPLRPPPTAKRPDSAAMAKFAGLAAKLSPEAQKVLASAPEATRKAIADPKHRLAETTKGAVTLAKKASEAAVEAAMSPEGSAFDKEIEKIRNKTYAYRTADGGELVKKSGQYFLDGDAISQDEFKKLKPKKDPDKYKDEPEEPQGFFAKLAETAKKFLSVALTGACVVAFAGLGPIGAVVAGLAVNHVIRKKASSWFDKLKNDLDDSVAPRTGPSLMEAQGGSTAAQLTQKGLADMAEFMRAGIPDDMMQQAVQLYAAQELKKQS